MKRIEYRDYTILLDYEYNSDYGQWLYAVRVVFPGGEKDNIHHRGFAFREVAIKHGKSKIDSFIESEKIILRRYVREIENGKAEDSDIVPWVQARLQRY